MGLFLVRYGIGVVMVFAGVALLVASPAGMGVEGFGLAVGGGASVLLLNFLFRLSVSGDLEREREEQARRYYDEHGEWPEEKPRAVGRQWQLPAGAVTPEQEARRRQAGRDA